MQTLFFKKHHSFANKTVKTVNGFIDVPDKPAHNAMRRMCQKLPKGAVGTIVSFL